MNLSHEDIGETHDPATETIGKKLKWSGKLEMVVTLLGYNVGLSDYWRFPYLVWRNGGGAFLFAFIVLLLITGLPTFFLELSSSQYCGKGIFQIWDVCPLLKGIGTTMALINFVYLVYDTTYRFWLLDYFFSSFMGYLPWASCNNNWNTKLCHSMIFNQSLLENNVTSTMANSTIQIENVRSPEEEFWQFKVLAMSSGISDIGSFRWMYVIYSIAYQGLVLVLIIKSVKSIGKVMYVTAIVPQVLVLAMFIQSLTLDGSTDGILYFITPDFPKLANPKIWIEAMFMVFYTLGPGWGGVTVIGSHAKFTDNCIRTSVISCVGDVTIAVFSGLVLFSVVGVMSSEIGLPIDEVVQSGMAIGLVGYTRAIKYLPFSNVWAVVFFLALFLTATDGQMMITETLMAFIDEWRKKTFNLRSRLIILTTISLSIIVFNLPFCTQGFTSGQQLRSFTDEKSQERRRNQAGAYMFQLVDWYQPTWPLIVCVLLEVIIFMWLYGGDRFDKCVSVMLGRKIPHVFRFALAFICPLMFLVLLLASFISYKPPTYGTYQYPPYAQAIGWIIAITMVLPIPLHMVVAIYREQGGILQRMGKLLKPCQSWGPDDIDYRNDYMKIIEEKRSFCDILYYNAIGRSRSLSAFAGDVQENEKLNVNETQNKTTTV